MRFLIDNSLSPRLASAITAGGHDAVHVRDLNLANAEDRKIFEKAAADARVLVAQDTDFTAILSLTQASSPSVILFRTRTRATDGLLRLLLDNLDAFQSALDAGAIVVIEDSRIRIRSLPIAGPGQG